MSVNRLSVLTAITLIFTLISAGCTQTGSQPPGIPTSTETPAQTAAPAIEPAQTRWWEDEPDYHSGIITADMNLFGAEIIGVIRENNGDKGYDVYNDLQRVIFVHREFGPLDAPPVNDLLIDGYGTPELIVFEKLDSSGDGRLDAVAVRYEGTEDGWIAEFNYFASANLKNYLDAFAEPANYPALIKN